MLYAHNIMFLLSVHKLSFTPQRQFHARNETMDLGFQ